MSNLLLRSGILQNPTSVVTPPASDTYTGTLTVGSNHVTRAGFQDGSYGTLTTNSWDTETFYRLYLQQSGSKALMMVELNSGGKYKTADELEVTIDGYGPLTVYWQGSKYHDGYQLNANSAFVNLYSKIGSDVPVIIEPIL